MKKAIKPDVVELINKIQEQISIIDRKIDTLISKSAQRPVDTRPVEPKPFQQPGRVLHKAVCADCKKGCEVPFKPSGERPVYCKDCFSKRKTRGPFGGGQDNRQRAAAPIQAPTPPSRKPFMKRRSPL